MANGFVRRSVSWSIMRRGSRTSKRFTRKNDKEINKFQAKPNQSKQDGSISGIGKRACGAFMRVTYNKGL